MQDQILRQLSEQLATLIRLIAISAGEGKTMRDRISVLSRAGMAPKEIAEVLGTSPNAVSVMLYQLKSPKTKKRKGLS